MRQLSRAQPDRRGDLNQPQSCLDAARAKQMERKTREGESDPHVLTRTYRLRKKSCSSVPQVMGEDRALEGERKPLFFLSMEKYVKA
ncbi:hypothetical protein ROHU_025143 [Labeo rohita]|uniref:Uncharacterized protein n=1 Tax=Labeo rohita TaxID=84645 RepID=A0A498MLP4_LABRO|nr:hypothetical protein ROHU_025143 [Labeo rohita]